MSQSETPEVLATDLGPVRPLSNRITDGLWAQMESGRRMLTPVGTRREQSVKTHRRGWPVRLHL